MTRRGNRGKVQKQQRLSHRFHRAWKSGTNRRISTFPQGRRRPSPLNSQKLYTSGKSRIPKRKPRIIVILRGRSSRKSRREGGRHAPVEYAYGLPRLSHWDAQKCSGERTCNSTNGPLRVAALPAPSPALLTSDSWLLTSACWLVTCHCPCAPFVSPGPGIYRSIVDTPVIRRAANWSGRNQPHTSRMARCSCPASRECATRRPTALHPPLRCRQASSKPRFRIGL